MSEELVDGRFHTHTMDQGFIYLYTCPQCQKEFKSTAPQLSVPSLCHSCYIGWNRIKRDRDYRLSKLRRKNLEPHEINKHQHFMGGG